MAQEARDLGLDIVALTDHNTNSGIREIPDAERKSGVTIIPGMELTTFHGHLLALGTTTYVEWRSLSRANIGSAISAIHAAGGLAGVAHPFHPGSPFCTGCFWDFDGPDWSHVDYLEVWSEADPWKKLKNKRAFHLWNDLLDSGHRIAAVSARDFHAPDRACLPAVTYLGIEERASDTGELIEGAKEALRAGRVFVTLGPLLSMAAHGLREEKRYGPGETIALDTAGTLLQVDVAWESNERRRFWEQQIESLVVVVQGNRGELAHGRVESGQGSRGFSLTREGNRWIRAELHGRVHGEETMIAFTNPVYLEQ
jgi:hypothetical protein